ncbi:MAG: CHAT domain-containing tetratricopeptide repeat protein [Acidobacteriota bacterium]
MMIQRRRRPGAAAIAAILLLLTTGHRVWADTGAPGSADDLYSAAHRLLSSGSPDDARNALPLLERALQGFRAEGNPAGEAETLYALAVATAFAGDPAAARDHGRLAIDRFVALGDPRGEAAARDHLGTQLAAAGELEPARRQLQTAVDLRRRIGDRGAEAASLHNLASVHLEAGDAGIALDLFAAAIERHRQLDQRAALASGLNNRGLLWLFVGRRDRGRDDLKSALALQRSLGDVRGQAGILNNLGLLAWFEARLPEARERFEAALGLYRSLGDDRGRAEVMGNLGLVDLEDGEPAAARRRIEAAVDLARAGGLSRVEAAHRGSLGRVLRAEGRLDEASEVLNAAAEAQRRSVDPWGVVVTLYDLARVERDRGRPSEALRTIDDGIRAAESVRSSLGVGDLRAHLLASLRHLYDLRIDLLMAAGEVELALVTAERARARSLLDLLRLAAGQPGSADDAATPPDPAIWRRLVDDDTEVLVFHVGNAEAWVWSVDRHRIRGGSLGASAALEELARTARHHLAHSHLRSHRGPARRVAARLAGTLFGPWSRRARRLAVVPDGALHRLPFGALLQSAEPGAEHDVVHLPSLAVLGQLRDRPQAATSGEVAILADPVFGGSDPRLEVVRTAEGSLDTSTHAPFERLPHSAAEARAVAELFPPDQSRLLLGFDASRRRLLSGELRGYRRLHVATHAVVDDREPERSGLVLSRVDGRGRGRDGFVGLRDLFDLRLDSELVVLSACRSALGPQLRGEGLIGLSRGFFAAGARRLVVSLWDVDDRATAQLMTHFYRALTGRTDGDAARALTLAQAELRRDPRWSAPFYWGGFVVLGDWR